MQKFILMFNIMVVVCSYLLQSKMVMLMLVVLIFNKDGMVCVCKEWDVVQVGLDKVMDDFGVMIIEDKGCEVLVKFCVLMVDYCKVVKLVVEKFLVDGYVDV